MKVRVEKQIGSQVFSIETGQLAKQAAGAVLVTYGETAVLVTATRDKPRPGIDFFPLVVMMLHAAMLVYMVMNIARITKAARYANV